MSLLHNPSSLRHNCHLAMSLLHNPYSLRHISLAGLSLYASILSAGAQVTIDRLYAEGALVPDRGDYVKSFTFENSGIQNLTSVHITLNLSSPNPSNPMWYGDMFASLTHGTASENERMGVLFNRPGVTAQDPWGNSDSSLSQTFDLSSALAGAWLPSDRWSLLVSDSQQGGIARIDSFSLSVTGTQVEGLAGTTLGSGDSISGNGAVNGTVNLVSSSPVASVAADIKQGDSLQFSDGMLGSSKLIKRGRGELVVDRFQDDDDREDDYSGEIDVSEGSLKLKKSKALGRGARIKLRGGGTELRLAHNVSLSNNVTLEASSNASKLLVSSGNASITSGIEGAGGFEKSGSGTLTIGGTNSYTGATHVSSGTLEVGGSITASDISVGNNAKLILSTTGNLGGDVLVQTGATLSGHGNITGNVTVQGSHSPGSSPGLQTFASGVTYDSTAQLVWELFRNLAAPADFGIYYDAIEITGGNLVINTGAVIDLRFYDPEVTAAPGASTVNWANDFWNINQTWQMIKLSGTGAFPNKSNQFAIGTIGQDAFGVNFATARPGASFTTFNSVDGVYISYVVPEPSVLSVCAALGTFLLIRRRR